MANQYTEAIATAKANRRHQIGDADSLARKPKTKFVLPESRQQKLENARLGDSIEDILERAHAMGFISQDDIKARLRECSSLINAPRRAR